MKKTREQKIRRRFCREFAGDLYFYCLLLTGSAEEAQGIARAVLGAEHTGLTLLEIKKSLYLMALESCREAVRSREEDALLPDSGQGLLWSFWELPFPLRSAAAAVEFAGVSAKELAEAEDEEEEKILERIAAARERLGFAAPEALREALHTLRNGVQIPDGLLQRRSGAAARRIAISSAACLLGIGAVLIGLSALSDYYRSVGREPLTLQAPVSASPTARRTPTAARPQPTSQPTPQETAPPQETGGVPIPVALKYGEDGAAYTYEFNAEKGTVVLRDQEGRIAVRMRFDDAGRKRSELRWSYSNSIRAGWTQRFYDEDGLLTEERKRDGSTLYRKIYTYEESETAQLIRITEHAGMQTQITEFEYYANGALRRKYTEKFWSDEGDLPSSWNESLYDENGNLVKTTDYLAGYLSSQYEYEYNEDGIRTEGFGVSFPASAGRYIDHFYKYDRSGMLVNSYTQYNGSFGEFYTTRYRDENGSSIINEMLEHLSDGKIQQSVYFPAFEIQSDSDYTIYGLLYNPDGTPAVNGTRAEDLLREIFKANTDKEFYEYQYDRDGNVISRICYHENPIIRDIMDCYAYDEEGRLSERKSYVCWPYDTEWELKEKVRYEYNEDGTLHEMLWLSETSYMGEFRSSFDRLGRLITYEKLNGDILVTFVYDETGALLQKKVNFGSPENFLSSQSLLYVYVGGKPVLQSGRIGETVLYFDETGKRTREETCAADGVVLTSTVFTYNDAALLEEKLESDAEGALRARTRYEYDEARELAYYSETVYGTDGTILSEKHSSMEENTMGEGMQLDENGALTAWNGTDALGNRVAMEFGAIDPDDPAYRLYTYCEYAELIP